MKAGRIAQVYLPVGAFLRHPVVQRVGPALEFWRILQRGIGRQQGITAVGMVHPLHHPAVVKGVFQLYSAHIVFTAHPVLVAFGQQAVQRRGSFQRLRAPQRHITDAVVAVVDGMILSLVAMQPFGLVQGNTVIPSAVIQCHAGQPLGGGDSLFEAQTTGKDDPGIHHRNGCHGHPHNNAPALHALKAPS